MKKTIITTGIILAGVTGTALLGSMDHAPTQKCTQEFVAMLDAKINEFKDNPNEVARYEFAKNEKEKCL